MARVSRWLLLDLQRHLANRKQQSPHCHKRCLLAAVTVFEKRANAVGSTHCSGITQTRTPSPQSGFGWVLVVHDHLETITVGVRYMGTELHSFCSLIMIEVLQFIQNKGFQKLQLWLCILMLHLTEL